MRRENTMEEWQKEWQKECPTLHDKLLRIQMISDTELNTCDNIKILQSCLRDIHKLVSLAKGQWSRKQCEERL